MRAPLLLPLLLLGVSSQDAIDTITTRPEENGQITTIGTSKAQKTTTASKPEDTPSAPTTPPAANQVATTINNPGNPPPTSVILPTTPQATTTTTSSLGNPSSTPATSPAANQGTTSANNLGNPPPTPTPSPQQPQPISTTIISGTPAATPAATSSVAQQKTVPPASSGNSSATTAVSAAPSHASGPPATPGGLTTAVTPYPSVGAQAKQPLNQSTSTAASTGVPTSSHAPGLRDHNVTSPTSVTKQPQSSPASPDQGLTFSTRPGSIKTSVTPFDGSVSPTTSKAPASSSPGSIHKVSEATTPTLEADQGRPASVSTKPTRTDPASAQPSSPTPDDQMVSSCSGQHQTPSTSSQNEVICEVKAQNNCPMIYLKEEKSCAEWKNASMNISFFESFCSTGQRAFNASRDRCTVTLTSHKPWSQQWAVQATVHFPLDPENIFKELKEKDKFKELGIVNTTYDKMEREMVINDELSTPLIITIVTLAGSLLLIAAIYGCCHQRFSQKKDQVYLWH